MFLPRDAFMHNQRIITVEENSQIPYNGLSTHKSLLSKLYENYFSPTPISWKSKLIECEGCTKV